MIIKFFHNQLHFPPNICFWRLSQSWGTQYKVAYISLIGPSISLIGRQMLLILILLLLTSPSRFTTYGTNPSGPDSWVVSNPLLPFLILSHSLLSATHTESRSSVINWPRYQRFISNSYLSPNNLGWRKGDMSSSRLWSSFHNAFSKLVQHFVNTINFIHLVLGLSEVYRLFLCN